MSRARAPEDFIAFVLSKSKGLRVSRINFRPDEGTVSCKPDNPYYPHYDIPLDDVVEIRTFRMHLTSSVALPSEEFGSLVNKPSTSVYQGMLRSMIEDVHTQLAYLHNQVGAVLQADEGNDSEAKRAIYRKKGRLSNFSIKITPFNLLEKCASSTAACRFAWLLLSFNTKIHILTTLRILVNRGSR